MKTNFFSLQPNMDKLSKNLMSRMIFLEEIISQIEDEQYKNLIISAIEGAFWDQIHSFFQEGWYREDNCDIIQVI